MVNEQNLIPCNKRSKEEVREIGRKGGIASGKARKEKKTNQAIMSDLLKMPCSSFPKFAEKAAELGIDANKPIKELFNAVCLLNTLNKGTVEDIGKLSSLLGENTEYEDSNGKVSETLAVIKETAYGNRDKQ